MQTQHTLLSSSLWDCGGKWMPVVLRLHACSFCQHAKKKVHSQAAMGQRATSRDLLTVLPTA